MGASSSLDIYHCCCTFNTMPIYRRRFQLSYPVGYRAVGGFEAQVDKVRSVACMGSGSWQLCGVLSTTHRSFGFRIQGGKTAFCCRQGRVHHHGLKGPVGPSCNLTQQNIAFHSSHCLHQKEKTLPSILRGLEVLTPSSFFLAFTYPNLIQICVRRLLYIHKRRIGTKDISGTEDMSNPNK